MARPVAAPSRGLAALDQNLVTAPIKPGAHHAHGCLQCSARYTDHCTSPEENGRCQSCRGQGARPRWDVSFDPRPCCRTDSFAADKVELARYSLGGPGPWFRCRTCSRTHPYSPNGRGRTP